MELLREWLCHRHLGLELALAEQRVLDRSFHWLEEQALAMPVAFVHRDWHARNLMDCATAGVGGNPGVLDFQDAVIGPVGYDLVSLTRDAYLDWPPATIAGWIADFHHEARAEGAPVPASLDEFTRQHDLIGVQRHIKVAGTFARLAERDGKRSYLNDVPRVFGHLQQVLPGHAALRELDLLLRERIAPAFAARRAADAAA
jgi:aminoglycoside/choline kinase family phosphotransferase